MKIIIDLKLDTNSPKRLKSGAISHTKSIIESFIEKSLNDLASRLKCNNIDISYQVVAQSTISGIPYFIESSYQSEEKCIMDGYSKTMDDDEKEVWVKNGSYAEVVGWK